MVRVTFLAAPFKRRMIEKMVAEFTPRVEYEIVSTRYPVPRSEWQQMTIMEKFDAQLFGGSTIRNLVRSSKPDVIYCDSSLYGAQFELATYLSSRRTPMVLHLRGDWWREFWAGFALSSTRRRILSTQQYCYNWSAVALATKITPICRWLQAVVRHYAPWKRSEVVYQGIDPDEFSPQPGFEVRRPAVAILQNHSILPKVEGLLNFRTVVEKLPAVQFYIAEGEGWAQQFLGLVRERYAGLSNVHFVKNVIDARAVSRMLTSCDCYVLSSGLDCCPTTVLEASLLEKPVLASRVGGVPEIVLNGYTGWTIDNHETNEWVSKIEMLVKDPKLSRRLGRQGRKWVGSTFGWATIAPQVERLIIDEAEMGRDRKAMSIKSLVQL